MNSNYKEAFGFLNHLNTEELRQILNNDSKLEDIIKDLVQDKSEVEKELLIASNRSLAEYNLSREPNLRSAKKELKDLSEIGEAVCKSVEEKLKRKTSSHDLEAILNRLKLAASEMEEESEKLADKFLEGEIDVDGFLERFASRRKLMHLRRVKSDKMTELITKRASPSSNVYLYGPPNPSSMSSPYPSLYQPPPPPAAAPYPLGNSAMPFPTPYSMY